MIHLKKASICTGYNEIDDYIQNYFDAFSDTESDESVFLNDPEDTIDLSCIGLHGRLCDQSPEFVLSISIQSLVLCHTFILYNNENGIHIFSIKDTLDTESEQFFAQEI